MLQEMAIYGSTRWKKDKLKFQPKRALGSAL
jgi:hypothetical protein